MKPVTPPGIAANRILLDFEERWCRYLKDELEAPPRVQDHLPGEGAGRLDCLVKLLLLDLEFRWKKGDPPELHEYLQPFEELRRDAHRLALVTQGERQLRGQADADQKDPLHRPAEAVSLTPRGLAPCSSRCSRRPADRRAFPAA